MLTRPRQLDWLEHVFKEFRKGRPPNERSSMARRLDPDNREVDFKEFRHLMKQLTVHVRHACACDPLPDPYYPYTNLTVTQTGHKYCYGLLGAMFKTANPRWSIATQRLLRDHSLVDRINIIEFMIGQRLGLIAGNKVYSWWVRHFGLDFGLEGEPADRNGSGPPTWRDYVRLRWLQDRTRGPKEPPKEPSPPNYRWDSRQRRWREM